MPTEKGAESSLVLVVGEAAQEFPVADQGKFSVAGRLSRASPLAFSGPSCHRWKSSG
jgi:hypothetical protein